MNKAAFLTAAVTLVSLSLSHGATADVAPPPVAPCTVLPPGAACFVDGDLPGICVEVPHKEPSGSHQLVPPSWVCRVVAADGGANAENAGTAFPPASSSPPPPPSTAPTPAKNGGCAIAPASDEGG